MLIAIEAAVFDPLGALELNALASSKLDTATRRVSRTATLDGNSVIIDNGYTAADSTLDIRAFLSPAAEATVLRLIGLYQKVICSTPSGCFTGVLQDVRRDGTGETSIIYLVQRALALTADL